MNDYISQLVSWLVTHVSISNVENFSMGIFGISVTIFTVLYSFITSKQDIGTELQEKILNSKASIEERTNYRIISRQIRKYRKINRYALGVCIGSLLLFVLCKLHVLFFLGVTWITLVIDILYLLLIFGTIVMFTLLVHDYYKKNT